MNIIKGLITKDLLQLKSYRKTLLVFIMIFILTGIVQQNLQGVENMVIIMLTLGFGMFSIATFNYDEQLKTDRYILTFPLTKKEIVLSKYILVICSTIVGAIIGIIASCVIVFLMSKQFPDFQKLVYIGIGGILGVGAVESIQLPCIYKFGAEKGRIQLFIVVALITLLTGGILFIGDKININLPINNIINIIYNFLPIILILLTIVIYFISYKLSCKIYSKKEI